MSGSIIGIMLNVFLALTSIAIGFYIFMQFLSLAIAVFTTFFGWLLAKFRRKY